MLTQRKVVLIIRVPGIGVPLAQGRLAIPDSYMRAEVAYASPKQIVIVLFRKRDWEKASLTWT